MANRRNRLQRHRRSTEQGAPIAIAIFMRQLLLTMVVAAAFSGCSKSESVASSNTRSARTSGEAVAAAAASAAPAAAQSALAEDEKCPPGAQCDGYCSPDQKQVANGPECWACTAKECDDPFYKGCSASPDRKTCEAIVECFHRTNCLTGGVVACYCGDAQVDECAAKGPSGGKCADLIASGFPQGTPPGLIIKSFGNPQSAGGFATGIGLCVGNFCMKKCVPYCAPRS